MDDQHPDHLTEELRALRGEVRRLKGEVSSLKLLGFLGLVAFANNSDIVPWLAGVMTAAGLIGLVWIGIQGGKARREMKPRPVRYLVTPSSPGASQIPLCTVTPDR
jgi:hypothetical protein